MAVEIGKSSVVNLSPGEVGNGKSEERQDGQSTFGELDFSEYTQGGLGRHLGVFSTIFLIVGRIIGTGIFSTPSPITSSAGSVGAALLLWVLGLLLAGSGLAVWLELGCMIPRSGGEKVYLEAAYRRPKLLVTVIFAVQAVALGFTAQGCIVFVSNMVLASGKEASEWEERGTKVPFLFHTISIHTNRYSVLVAISAFGNVITVTFAQARVNQELAKEGVIPFPTFWASSWPFGSPSSGLLLHFIPSLIVIVAIPFGDAYNFILDLEGYPSSIINLLVVSGLFYLRWTEPNVSRPFRAWWPVAVFFMAGQAFQVVAPFIRPPAGKGDTSLPYWLYPVVGIAVLFAGVVYWGVWQVLLPWVGGYRLQPEHVVLKDGTTVAVYRKKRD